MQPRTFTLNLDKSEVCETVAVRGKLEYRCLETHLMDTTSSRTMIGMSVDAMLVSAPVLIVYRMIKFAMLSDL